MFCDRCEGEHFILIFDTHIGSVTSEGSSKTWMIWECLECNLYKRIVEEKIIRKGVDEKDNGLFR